MATIDRTLFDTNNHVLDRDFVAEIIRAFPEYRRRAPILAMLLAGAAAAVAPAAPTMNEKFEWRDAELIGRTTAVNNGGAAYDAASTSIVVDDGTVLPAGCMVLCDATGEVMFVSAVATNTLTVVRGVGSANGGVAAAAGSVADNAALKFIGFAAGEGSGAGPTQAHPLGAGWNYVQEFTRTVKVTGRVAGEETKTEDLQQVERGLMFEELIDDIENHILFGSRGVTANAAGERVTSTHGVYNAITTNVINPAGTITLKYFEESFLRPIFEAGGSADRHLFAGSTVCEAIDALYASQIRRQREEAARRFVPSVETRHGTVYIHKTLQLTGSRAGEGVCLDLDASFRLRHKAQPAMGNREAYDGMPRLFQNLGANDATSLLEEWRCLIGLQWGNEANHGRIKGVTGSA